MNKKLLFVIAIVMLLVFQAFAADQVSVTGKWEITSQSPRGQRTHDIEFVKDGDTLKVKMESRRGMIEAVVTLEGDNIEWTITRETNRGSFSATYKGVVSGDTMTGKMDTPRGKRDWSAKRKKETK